MPVLPGTLRQLTLDQTLDQGLPPTAVKLAKVQYQLNSGMSGSTGEWTV